MVSAKKVCKRLHSSRGTTVSTVMPVRPPKAYISRLIPTVSSGIARTELFLLEKFSLVGATIKGKNLLPKGANSFL